MASGLARLVSSTQRELTEKKGIVVHKIGQIHTQQDQASPGVGRESVEAAYPSPGLQPTEALKVFFDRIPVSSIPGLRNAGVLELTSSESMASAIRRLYSEKVMGAPVRDESIREADPLADYYIGMVDFGSMVLWALEEFEQAEVEAKNRGLILSRPQGRSGTEKEGKNQEQSPITADSGFLVAEVERLGFFETFEQHPSVRDTKVASMARCFRLRPFLPVRPEDTLLDILLRLSKHSLKAIPVVDPYQPKVTGFVTKDAAVRLLLQCAGLEWFDAIAEKQLSDFKFEMNQVAGQLISVTSDAVVLSAMRLMWKHRLSGVPVIHRESKKLVGHIRSTDMRLLVENVDVFEKRRVMRVAELMKLDSDRGTTRDEKADDEHDVVARFLAGSLKLGSGWRGGMMNPVTSRREETLKSSMAKIVQGACDRSFLVDEHMQVIGVISLRDIILQFAPPLTQMAFNMGGFFPS